MPLKILFISHHFYPDLGGIEVNSAILAQAFQDAGHQVRLMTWTKSSEENSFHFPIIRNPNFRSLVREHRKADLVFENNPSLRLSWPAFFLNRARVVALRTWIQRLDGRIAWQDQIKKFCLSRASAVIAVSEALRQKTWEQAIVIGNPYRSDIFRIMPEAVRHKHFVFLGRLVSDKGADLAIWAFKELLSQVPNEEPDDAYQLTIIGEGPERPHLEALALRLGLKDRVNFTGSLSGEELVARLNEHHFLLVPSIWEEPFGNVALEGMACGCIPIVSDGGGLPDAVGRAGLLFKRGDQSALKNAMRLLLIDLPLVEKLKQAAGSHLQNHHPNRIAAEYLQVIHNIFEKQANR